MNSRSGRIINTGEITDPDQLARLNHPINRADRAMHLHNMEISDAAVLMGRFRDDIEQSIKDTIDSCLQLSADAKPYLQGWTPSLTCRHAYLVDHESHIELNPTTGRRTVVSTATLPTLLEGRQIYALASENTLERMPTEIRDKATEWLEKAAERTISGPDEGDSNGHSFDGVDIRDLLRSMQGKASGWERPLPTAQDSRLTVSIDKEWLDLVTQTGLVGIDKGMSVYVPFKLEWVQAIEP